MEGEPRPKRRQRDGPMRAAFPSTRELAKALAGRSRWVPAALAVALIAGLSLLWWRPAGSAPRAALPEANPTLAPTAEEPQRAGLHPLEPEALEVGARSEVEAPLPRSKQGKGDGRLYVHVVDEQGAPLAGIVPEIKMQGPDGRESVTL